MIPLNLTAREQCFLAEICSVLRGPTYDVATDVPVDPARVWDRLENVVIRFGLSPGSLDGLCDRLDRTGSNS